MRGCGRVLEEGVHRMVYGVGKESVWGGGEDGGAFGAAVVPSDLYYEAWL